jgi:hypothetical protein
VGLSRIDSSGAPRHGRSPIKGNTGLEACHPALA